MLGTDFYHQLTKKYITIFGLLFNDINIARNDANGDEIEKMKVPLSYGAKDKMLGRIIADPDIAREPAIVLPRMSFLLGPIMYDGDRVLQKIGKKVVAGDDPNHMKVQYTPAAYNFAFSLFVYVKNSEDGTKIVEQILPFFKPDFTVKAHLLPEMSQDFDIPIILRSVTPDDRFEGDFKDRRTIIWQLDFILKGYLFGPVFSKPIIKFVEITETVGTPDDHIDPSSRLAVYPGLTANGTPTTNGELTIDVNLIEFDDDYGDIVVLNNQPFPANTYPFDR